MRSVAIAVCLLVTSLLLTGAYAQDADTAYVGLDARAFDVSGTGIDWDSSKTLSVGVWGAVNEITTFNAVFSRSDFETSRFNGTRQVISPSFRYVIQNTKLGGELAFSAGADVATEDFTLSRTGGTITQNDFTPAIALDYTWGGKIKWTLSGKVAWYDTLPATTGTLSHEGFGTISSLGGSVMWPICRKWAFIGDAMVPVDGNNSFDKDTGVITDEPVWTAGLGWKTSESKDARFLFYVTNVLSPSFAGSVLGSPDNELGYGVAFMRAY